MQSGLRVYNEMKQEITLARDETSRIANALEALNTKLHQARSNEAQQAAELARLRLDLLAANQIASGLDAADQHALSLLQDRTTRLEQLSTEIEASAKQQTTLETEREQLLAVYDQALSGLNITIETAREALHKTVEFRTQREHADVLTLQAQYAEEKANLAEQDHIEKRKPYEQDRLFVYLWERRFGFPDYQSGPLIRSLDGWVARLIGYDHAQRNYRLLLALADHMREHAVKQKQVADVAETQVSALDQEALAAAGVPLLHTALLKAETELHEHDKQLDNEEHSYKKLLDQRAAMAAGTDPFTTEAIAILETQMSREDLDSLRRDVQITHTPKDDALVAKLANLRATTSDLSDQINRLQMAQNQIIKQFDHMQKLQVRFRNEGYHSNNSEFEDALSIGSVLQSIFHGALDMDNAWKQIEQRQKFRIPLAIIKGIGSILAQSSSRHSSSSKRSGSGGFRTGGSSGGGGFRTGGGF